MRKLLSLSVAVLFSMAPTLFAQEPEPRAFCDDNDPDNNCPGDDCVCVDDTIEIVFQDDLESSLFEYENFDAEQVIRGRVLIDVKSDQIRGYSFGVAHNTADINPLVGPLGLNIDGGPDMADPSTASAVSAMGGFQALRLIVVDGERKGFILAIVLNFSMPVVLPVERSVVVNCNYQLERDVGPEGTMLTFDETLGNPPTQLVLTVDQLEFPDVVDKDEMNCTEW